MLIHHASIAYDTTMYKHVKRLPPGHFMIVDKDGFTQIERYWKPENIKINERISEGEAQKKFLDLFQLSIEDRIENISTTSFELSGGLDSSSVVSMASQMYPDQQLHINSMNFGTLPRCDESEYLDSMNHKFDLKTMRVSVDKLDYKDQYSLEYNYTLDPYWPILITHTMQYPVAELLKSTGIKSVLTGQGGDHILAGNPYSLHDYLKNFHWLQIYRELKAAKRPMRMLKRYMLLPSLNKKFKQFIKSTLKILRFKKLNNSEEDNISKKSYHEISDQFPKETLSFWHDLNALVNAHQSLISDVSAYHVVGKHYDIEFRHPFYDRRLMEFMLSLPAKFKYREGVTKVLLRKAMKGILPEKIRNRSDKAEFSAVLRQQIDAIDLDKLLNDSLLASLGLIEQQEIDQLKEQYISGKMKTILYFWRIINLEYWYRYNFAPETLEDRKKVQNDDRV